MTNARLQKLASKWQKRLRLQDWHLAVFFAVTDKSEIDGEYCVGCTDASPMRKTADIKILEPKLWKHNSRTPGYRGLAKEIELTLIHEMIHCHFQFKKLPRSWSVDDFILENGIESLAIAFFNMYESVN